MKRNKGKKPRATQLIGSAQVAEPSAAPTPGEPSHPSLHAAAQPPNLHVVRSSVPDHISESLGRYLVQAFRSQAAAVYAEAALLDDRVMGIYDLDRCPVLATLPRMAWDLRTAWRHELARAYDDLADDVAAGEWPDARCGGEEWALYRVILRGDGQEGVDDADRQHPEALRQVYDYLMEGEDLDEIFAATNGGGFLPRESSMHPRRWFRPFTELPPRDPDRGFMIARAAPRPVEPIPEPVLEAESETWWAAGS